MKEWIEAAIEELEITATAHDWLGDYEDAGRTGDNNVGGDSSTTPLS